MTATSSPLADEPVHDAGSSTLGITAPAGSRARTARLATITWYVCGAILVAWAAGYLTWPFSNDQGNLAWVGDVVRSGGMPYRDAWDVKGPAAHILFALAGVFGRNEWGLRVFDLIILAAGVWATWRLASRYGGVNAARWTVVLYLLWYASLDHHATAQPDGWAAVMVACAVAVVMTRDDRPAVLPAVVAGALIGVCALIKPSYALLLALPVVDALAHTNAVSRMRVVRTVLAAVIGFAIPIAATLAWFARADALGAWRDVHLVWIPTSYTAVDSAWFNRLQYVASFLSMDRFGPAVALATAGVAFVRRSSSPRDVLTLTAWPILVVLGVTMQGAFYMYHWHPLFPALAVLAGVAIARALTTMESSPRVRHAGTTIATAVVVVTVAGALIEPTMHVYRQARYAVGLMDGRELDRIEFGPFGHHGGVFPEVIAYLRAKSQPSDRVLVWGSGAGINYLSGRASPSPFGFVQPLVDPPDSELRRRYRADFLRDLTSRPPRYVVSLGEPLCVDLPTPDERKQMGVAEGLIRCLGDVPDVRAYVLDHYALAHRIGPLEIREWR